MSVWFQSGRIVKDEIGKIETRFFTKYSGSQESEVWGESYAYAYALCPMPYALCPREHLMLLRKAILCGNRQIW